MQKIRELPFRFNFDPLSGAGLSSVGCINTTRGSLSSPSCFSSRQRCSFWRSDHICCSLPTSAPSPHWWYHNSSTAWDCYLSSLLGLERSQPLLANIVSKSAFHTSQEFRAEHMAALSPPLSVNLIYFFAPCYSFSGYSLNIYYGANTWLKLENRQTCSVSLDLTV